MHAGKCKVTDFLKVVGVFKSLNGKLAGLEEGAKLQAPSLRHLFAGVPDLGPHIEAVEEMYVVEDGACSSLLFVCGAIGGLIRDSRRAAARKREGRDVRGGDCGDSGYRGEAGRKAREDL